MSSLRGTSLAFPSSKFLFDCRNLVLEVLLGLLVVDVVHRVREPAAVVEHGVRGRPDVIAESLEVLVMIMEAVDQILPKFLREGIKKVALRILLRRLRPS